jgi:hypothetical protein
MCNIAVRTPNHISIFFHGGSRYDFNLIIKELNHPKIEKVTIIPKHHCSYVAFSIFIKVDQSNIFELRVLDSYKFLTGSLSSLVESLAACPSYNELNKKYFLKPFDWRNGHG